MRAVLSFAAVYVGAVIGAGFSSGQELMSFFVLYGTNGLYGILTAGVLFSIFGAVVLNGAYTWKTTSHEQLFHAMCGPFLGSLVDILQNIFLFCTLSVLFAAAGSLFVAVIGWPYWLGIWCTAAIVYLCHRYSVTSLFTFNTICVALLLLLTLALIVPLVIGKTLPYTIPNYTMTNSVLPKHWLLSSLLYVSFNVGLSISPLAAIGRQLPQRTSAYAAATIGGIVLGCIGALLVYAMLLMHSFVNMSEIPIMEILRHVNHSAMFAYAFVLFLAILTSCFTTAYGLIHRLRSVYNEQHWVTKNVSLLAIPLAYAGFSRLVQMFYPIMGYVTLIIVVLAVIRWHRMQTSPS